MRLKSLTTSVLASVLASSAVFAADAGFSDTQKQDIQKLVHDYIVSNPEVLVEASQVLQQKQQASFQKKVQSAISENAAELFNDTMSIGGNPKGTVTVVEFFDYQCVHCKKMAPVIEQVVAGDKNLRVIYKEFPIFGEESEYASKAALAASMQGKYQALHDGLLKADKKLTNQEVMNIAKAAGINTYKLKTDMTSKAVTDALAKNRELAEKLHLMGTPAFIVAATPDGQLKSDSEPAFVPGAITEQALQDLIKKSSTKA